MAIEHSTLRDLQVEIEGHARAYGLDFFPVIFEVLSYEQINEVAAYGGFPTRYPHWRHGMEYEQLKKSYAYGLSKIYELVINNNPSYAYLLASNSIVDQKLVMAHVYGHVDFFKNNQWFVHTNRKMMDEMANHATRIRRYAERYGVDPVEEFIDRCLSIENLIDPHAGAIVRHRAETDEDPSAIVRSAPKMKSKDYLDRYVNPRDYQEKQRKRIEEERHRKKKFPPDPERDILGFLLEYAPLERWQQDILSIVRDEALYFVPQAQTKIMNEGWASFWHSTIMTQKCLTDAEVIDYADHFAGTLGTRPGSINPYKIGLELFREIEDRWNRGQFGKEWDDCDDVAKRRNWDRKTGLGRQKIFEVRRIYNDLTFIDTFLTPEFCERLKLFTYAYNPQTNQYVIQDRDFRKVKERLLAMLTNQGSPILAVEDANFENRGELLVLHRHEGADLELAKARETLKNLQSLWGRPVHLATTVNGTPKRIAFDGKEFKEHGN